MHTKIWTVQKRFVVNHALKNGAYYPEFGYSDYLEENHKLSELYDFLLSSIQI